MFPELEAAKRFPETKKGADIVPFPGKKDAVESESGLPLDPAFKQVLQFKITLKGISPPIWRRLLVPEDHTFWDLHVAIQNAMGWDDMHLHQFELSAGKKRPPVLIGLPSPEFEFETGESLLPGWGCRVSDYLSLENPKANYIYDFGDDWLHAVVLEKVLGRQKGQSYPLCIKGKRACPPEDCGSIPGYYNLVEAMEHPGSEEYEELLEWLGEEYDPDQFNADAIVFSDPRAQLKDVVI